MEVRSVVTRARGSASGGRSSPSAAPKPSPVGGLLALGHREDSAGSRARDRGPRQAKHSGTTRSEALRECLAVGIETNGRVEELLGAIETPARAASRAVFRLASRAMPMPMREVISLLRMLPALRVRGRENGRTVRAVQHRIGDNRPVRRWLAGLSSAGAFLFLVAPAGSTVRIDPHFQSLNVMGDRILLTSVDGRRLVCLSTDGKKLWERQFRQRIVLGAYDKDSLYVQDGTALHQVHLSAGTLSPLGALPAHQLLGWLPSEGLATSVDDRFGVRSFRMLDPKSLALIWETDSLESVVDVIQDTVVGVRAKRSYEKGGAGYTLSNATVVGLNRRNGALKWEIPLLNRQASSARAARAGSLLVVIDDPFTGGRLFCLDPGDGKILSSLAGGDDWSSGRNFLDVSMDGAEFVYLDKWTCNLRRCPPLRHPARL